MKSLIGDFSPAEERCVYIRYFSEGAVIIPENYFPAAIILQPLIGKQFFSLLCLIHSNHMVAPMVSHSICFSWILSSAGVYLDLTRLMHVNKWSYWPFTLSFTDKQTYCILFMGASVVYQEITLFIHSFYCVWNICT